MDPLRCCFTSCIQFFLSSADERKAAEPHVHPNREEGHLAARPFDVHHPADRSCLRSVSARVRKNSHASAPIGTETLINSSGQHVCAGAGKTISELVANPVNSMSHKAACCRLLYMSRPLPPVLLRRSSKMCVQSDVCNQGSRIAQHSLPETALWLGSSEHTQVKACEKVSHM